MDKHHHSPAQPDRRNFITRAAAVVIGGIISVFPVLAGLSVLFDPLRRKSESGGAVRVASLNSLPENGKAVKVPVVATLVDAWNRTPDVPIGQVYLQKIGPNQARAFNVVCPHLGCSVKYRPDENHFHCPCHNSSFAADGKILDPASPSPRGLDELVAEVRPGGEIWVKFQKFRSGVREKIPV